jgi:hypothetical protein
MTSEARHVTAVRTERVRIILGMLILILSCALLIWGFLPTRREVQTRPISPTELQLPTPSSFIIEPGLFSKL